MYMEKKKGRVRGLNPGPPPPKGGIIPLDQPDLQLLKFTPYQYSQIVHIKFKHSLLSSHYLHLQLALKPSQINTSNIITITIFLPQNAKSEDACDARGTVLSETHYVCGSGCIVLQRLLRPVMGTLSAHIRLQMGNYTCKPKLRSWQDSNFYS